MTITDKIMGLRKLDHEEQNILSKKITKLTELNQKAIADEAKGYTYDWMQLEKHINMAVLNYEHILNTTECVDGKSE